MQYFNFQRLIRKYSSPFTAIIEKKGEYDDAGKYIGGETVKKELTGAIISVRADKQFRSAGTITSNDRQLYMLEPIDRALLGATIVYNGRKYKVHDDTENAQFTGVYSYLLKYVSAFGEGD